MPDGLPVPHALSVSSHFPGRELFIRRMADKSIARSWKGDNGRVIGRKLTLWFLQHPENEAASFSSGIDGSKFLGHCKK